MNALTDNFKTQKGDSYAIPGTLDYQEVDRHFKKLGYKICKVYSKGRYYVVSIAKDGCTYILKMSSSLSINETLLNERSWNVAMYNRCLDTEYLRVPKVERSGSINGLEYIVTEYFEGERFVDYLGKEIETNSVYEALNTIVRSNLFLDNQKGVMLYKNEVEDKEGLGYKKVSEKAKKYMGVAETFIREVKDYNIVPLLEFVKGYEDMEDLGLNHNEFEPYNFIYSNGIISLYHGERASARSPRFFDVAIMFSKLYYTLSQPNLALEYLKIFLRNYEGDAEYFKFSFRTMLASRLIGGYWDYTRGYENDITMLEKCKDQLIDGTLFKIKGYNDVEVKKLSC